VLTTLTARTFRNLEPLEWSPGAGSHLLLGGNGAGKTSLLEALYVVATTKSFRTAHLADCTRHGGDGFHLAAEVEAAARVRLEVGWRRLAGDAAGQGGGERYRAVNGSMGSLAEHLGVLPVVAWTAADGEVLTGAPALRRRFLDRGAVGIRPAALEALARYRRALSSKRELLAAPGRVDDAELASWNAVLAPAAAQVMALRRDYARRLQAELDHVLRQAALPFPPIALRYRPSPALRPEADGGEGSAGKVAADAVLARLEGAAAGERRRGMPLVGPHRDDLEVSWGGHPVRATVSAGERKALSLLLTAAHGRVLAAAGRDPVYLLDDVDAELSGESLGRVWEAYSGVAQLFATSNRPGVWQGLPAEHRWKVAEGAVKP
jgi:DNA replication and repair protein RecF